MAALLGAALKRFIREGRLDLIHPDGRAESFGEPGAQPTVTIRLARPGVLRRIMADPQLKLGEAWMAGDFTVENGSIADLLDLLTRNLAHSEGGPAVRALEAARRATRRLRQFNPRARAARNVAHHYDLSAALYDLFLDGSRQYSCAFFETEDASLEEAQQAKLRRIAAKLRLRPGDRVLDIGSGWGGLAAHLARAHEARVTGVTLSREQLAWSRDMARREGLADRIAFEPLDYRDVRGVFDRVVSVGMLEHVGVNAYRAYFNAVASRMAPDGVGLIHLIGRSDGPGVTNPWIAKYIFPGGYTPALSELLPAIERAGLIVADVDVWRMHYAFTLAEWRRRFLANAHLLPPGYDGRFRRMWEFYLAGAEMGFRNQGLVVFQIQLVRRIDALPFTRDYMTPAGGDG